MEEKKKTKKICLSVTAHADAGKTTLLESMLLEAGALRSRGRVDHHDSRLDTEDFERAKGITAFSKSAWFCFGNSRFSVVDTPGHADLFPETRRGLSAPDAAVLVISGSEGIQADTHVIWEQLKAQRLPVWIFVSKMDLGRRSVESLMEELRQLSDDVVCFSSGDNLRSEQAAERDEVCLEEYLAEGTVSDESLGNAILAGRIIPCFFGSGLRGEGVRSFLEALDRWCEEPKRADDFSAICYKISYDSRGRRLSHVKITGGTLHVRDSISVCSAAMGEKTQQRAEDEEDHGGAGEKVTEIRLYNGAGYESVQEIGAGCLCCLVGLRHSAAGMLLGAANVRRSTQERSGRSAGATEEGSLRYELELKEKLPATELLMKLKELEEEFPELSPRARGTSLTVCIRGRVQEELFLSLLEERYWLHGRLGEGYVVYRESIRGRVEGMGHFEPLRHYAEVHLILEGLPAGSGLVIDSRCREEELDRNWQNLALDALRSRPLSGVLTGADLTDLHISLVSGRAHLKHTEGGDFREAAFRALRQGLMKAESFLLEPLLELNLQVPTETLGRCLQDLRAMKATALQTENADNGMSLVQGTVPLSELGDYRETLMAYTHGRGKITIRPGGEQACHNEEEVIAASDYHPESDPDWTADSVFCSHGAGRTIPWQEAERYMHLPAALREKEQEAESRATVNRPISLDDRELEEIMLREFGPVRRKSYGPSGPGGTAARPGGREAKPRDQLIREEEDAQQRRKPLLIIDGYNLLFHLESEAEKEKNGRREGAERKLEDRDLDAKREILMNRLSSYAGFAGHEIILVFDAYRVRGGQGSKETDGPLHLVYTAEGETADACIERLVSEIGKNERVSVVTGDGLIRLTAARSGVLRIGPGEFRTELEEAEANMRQLLERNNLLPHLQSLQDSLSRERD